MKQTTIQHFGLARWIRWSEQQAKVILKYKGIAVFTFKDIQCIWIGG